MNINKIAVICVCVWMCVMFAALAYEGHDREQTRRACLQYHKPSECKP